MTEDKDNLEYTLIGVKELSNFDRKFVKKNKKIIETHTTTKITIKTFIEEE